MNLGPEISFRLLVVVSLSIKIVFDRIRYGSNKIRVKISRIRIIWNEMVNESVGYG